MASSATHRAWTRLTNTSWTLRAAGLCLVAFLLAERLMMLKVVSKSLALREQSEKTVEDCRDVNDSEDFHISLVVATRIQSDYGGDAAHRLQRCISVLTEQLLMVARETQKRAEVVVVEWDPLPGEQRVHDFLAELIDRLQEHNSQGLLQEDPSWVEVRTITVPRDWLQLHNVTYFREYHAKNVGIRRARGRWLLVFNQDNLFPMPTIRKLFSEQLHPAAFYRTRLEQYNSNDIISDYVAGVHPSQKRLQLDGMKPQQYTEVLVKALSSYKLFPKRLSTLSCAWTCSGLDQTAEAEHPEIFSEEYYQNCFLRALFLSSGDFILATTAAWQAIGGFIEGDVADHVDSYQLFRMFSRGLRQVELYHGCLILHQSHEFGKGGRKGLVWGEHVISFGDCIKRYEEELRAGNASTVTDPVSMVRPVTACETMQPQMDFGFKGRAFEEHILKAQI